MRGALITIHLSGREGYNYQDLRKEMSHRNTCSVLLFLDFTRRLTQDDTQQDYPLTLKTEPLYFFAALLLQHNLPTNQLKISAFTTFAYIYCSHSY